MPTLLPSCDIFGFVSCNVVSGVGCPAPLPFNFVSYIVAAVRALLRTFLVHLFFHMDGNIVHVAASTCPLGPAQATDKVGSFVGRFICANLFLAHLWCEVGFVLNLWSLICFWHTLGVKFCFPLPLPDFYVCEVVFWRFVYAHLRCEASLFFDLACSSQPFLMHA